MIQTIQRAMVALILFSALAWCALGVWFGLSPTLIAALLPLFLLPHLWVLTLQFWMLSRWGRDPQVPPPTTLQRLRAWAEEVAADVRVFCWRQPFRAGYQTRLPTGDGALQGQRGLLLVHGFVCNRGLWRRWMERLDAAGVPWEAVTLEPPFASIDTAAPIINAAAQRLQRRTGLAPVVVAHSMGGLATRAWLGSLPEGSALQAVHRIVTVGTPHRGTWLGRFATTVNGREMRLDSPWLKALRAREDPALVRRYTCIYSHLDNIVFPASTARLPGAEKLHLPGVAHVAMVDHPMVWLAALEALRAPLPDARSAESTGTTGTTG